MAKIPAHAYAQAFRRNSPNVRLDQDEAEELVRLFHEAQKEAQAHGEILALRRYAAAREMVETQARDDGLWFAAETAPEAYLQQELRRLHAAIEEQP